MALPRNRPHRPPFALAVLAAGALVIAACTSSGSDRAGEPNADERAAASSGAGAYQPQTGELSSDAATIMTGDAYGNARWSYLVQPLDGDDDWLARDADVITPMASNTKLYTVGTWVEAYGVDHRFTTPVHQVGDDLVLVAAGDLTLGGREADTGDLAYSIPPQIDANGIPGAEPAPGDPLAGMDDLAAQVAAAGIADAADVQIDDRLFETTYLHDQVVSPIVVNDNIVGIQTTPSAEGDPAQLEMIPETQAFTIENQVTTVAAGGDTSVEVVPADQTVEGDPIGTTMVVQGTVAADSDPLLNVFDVNDPATFARTLFIEALERAGVTVAADATAANDPSALPDTYDDGSTVASMTSPTVGETATLIWKISHNYGANLALCLLAVQTGSTDCDDGFGPMRDNMSALDLDGDDVWFIDGAGAQFSSTTPRAMVTWVRWLRGLSWGDQLHEMLPILGVDGSLGLTQKDTPATGKVQGKSGTWVGGDPSTGFLQTPAQTLAGLMQAPDGTEYVFSLDMAGATFPTAAGVIDGTNQVNDVAAKIQESLPS